ncbi:MAG: hypothetical protein SGJ02_05990 [bacterium]|nr:hypothetical protein [bacterium]
MSDTKTLEFIAKAKLVHGEKYNYDYSNVVYINKRTKVKIYCPKHDHHFEQFPGVHINQKQRCKFCGKESGDAKQTITNEEYIKSASARHNNYYDYSKCNYTNSYSKVTIICPQHGDFEVEAKSHDKNKLPSGCPKCGDIKAGLSRRKGNKVFIDRAVEVFGEDKFNCDKVDYQTVKDNVIIKCNKHNCEFEVTPGNFLKNIHNCPECVKEINKELLYTTEEFINQCKEAHGDLYDYSKSEYSGAFEKVDIICKKHGVFKQGASLHKRGSGCPNCSISKGELAVKAYLESNNIEFEQQKIFDGCKYKSLLKFDFYLPVLNIAIEFQGQQHFEPISCFGGQDAFELVQLRDQIKKEFCEANNIKLLCITNPTELECLI